MPVVIEALITRILHCLSRMFGVTDMTTATALNCIGKVSARKSLITKYNIGEWVGIDLQGLATWHGFYQQDVRDSLMQQDVRFIKNWGEPPPGRWARNALRYDLTRPWRAVQRAVFGDSGSCNMSKNKPSTLNNK